MVMSSDQNRVYREYKLKATICKNTSTKGICRKVFGHVLVIRWILRKRKNVKNVLRVFL
jgi:hypothetical protein